MKLREFLQMTMPAYIVSTVLFYYIFWKIIGTKLVNISQYKKILIILGGGIYYVVALQIIDSFETTKSYHPLFMGIFLGMMISSYILTIPNKKDEKK